MKRFFFLRLHGLARGLHRVWQRARRDVLLYGLKSCGQNVQIYMPIRIDDAANVEIGDNVNIAPFVHMWGGGNIKIGSRVMIGPHTAIASVGHDAYKRSMYGTFVKRQVTIEDGVWIGAHCVILPGVTVGEGALIGAGSIVATSVKPYSIVVTGRQREEWRRPLVGERRGEGGKSSKKNPSIDVIFGDQ